MTFQPCFLAVEMQERRIAKSAAASSERKPPEIFCLSLINGRPTGTAVPKWLQGQDLNLRPSGHDHFIVNSFATVR